MEQFQLRIFDRDGQRAHRKEFDVQLLADFGEHLVSQDIEFGFFGAGHRVIAGVDDRRVGHRGLVADVVLLFQDQYIQFVLRKVPGDERTDSSRPNHNDISHSALSIAHKHA